MLRTLRPRERLSGKVFRAVHRGNLVYNTCWEDPALDREALDFQPDDRVLVITSAGCNALDYLLTGVAAVHAVDVNPIQNALLELKVQAIRHLDYASFFELFGQGQTPQARQMYQEALRDHLTPAARRYWDRHISFFNGDGWRGSFYYRGSSGLLAKVVLTNAHVLHRLGKPIRALLAAGSLEEQRDIYRTRIREQIWTPWLRWFLARPTTLSLLGVPWPQRQQIIDEYPGGVAKLIRDALDAVLLELPFHDNYFWRVYVQGHYTPECCPEYLKAANFERLRAGLLDRLHIHTCTVTDLLTEEERQFSKFVLLDHMDWMAYKDPPALAAEWNALLARARPGSRVIFRSAGLRSTFVDHLQLRHRGREHRLDHLLRFHTEKAAQLHARDRVHTYGSFYIADLPDDTGS